MLFNSYIFIFAFLPFTFFIYFYLNSLKLTVAAKAFLVFASLFFYGWWEITYVPIMLSSMLFNYVLGISLSKYTQDTKINKKILLSFGIVVNVVLLGYFKYADFLIANVNRLLDTHIGLLHLTLPLAISFFTFQQIAYLVDSYRGKTKEYDFLNYANFVTFFPQLIAGPIVHHSEMMPQFAKTANKVIRYPNIAMGLFIFSIGLFKKVIIADTFSVWATAGFDHAPQLHMVEAWVTSLSYTFQLYFDFSGYTDMAIGLARMFGILLPMNFFSPYKATSIIDFWRRWHITLSRFLKECLYIPLGGSRVGSARKYSNLVITMSLAGLWHGAGWTFVLWGTLHGLLLAVNHWFRHHVALLTFLNRMPPYLLRVTIEYSKRTITFILIIFLWVIFRADSLSAAWTILSSMVSFSDTTSYLSLVSDVSAWKHIAVLMFITWFIPNTHEIMGIAEHCIITYKSNVTVTGGIIIRYLRWQPNWFWCVCISICTVASILNLYSVSEFLYFNF